jgi:pantoate--beta-alanine ligase
VPVGVQSPAALTDTVGAVDVLTTPADMRRWSDRVHADGERIAVVPTMGALHGGHVALVERAFAHGDRVVVTIFVNPLQFNEPADFDRYPRPIDDDLDSCRRLGVAAVYAPTAAAMYGAAFQTRVVPGDLAERLEGPMRPGHFEGVTTVVTKLLNATRPHAAIFGEKDFQQLAIIRRMVLDLDVGVDIIGAPIVREPDGLAMSSRNVRLGPDDRTAATVLSRALFAARECHADGERNAGTLRQLAIERISAEPRATLEYVELVDATTLVPVEMVVGDAALLTAAWFGDVRLIDNVQLSAEQR